MSYTNLEGRQEILDELGGAADQIGIALAALGEAYERVDEAFGDRLEAALFGPVQTAYGRAKRSHARFGDAHGVAPRAFAQPGSGAASSAKALLERAVDAIRGADDRLGALQDTMLPVEVGDPALRAELSEIRELLGPLPSRARELTRSLGR